MIIGWLLYLALGFALASASVSIGMWQFWVILANVVAIDVWSHVNGKGKK